MYPGTYVQKHCHDREAAATQKTLAKIAKMVAVIEGPHEITAEFLSAQLGTEVIRFEVAPVKRAGVNGDVRVLTVWHGSTDELQSSGTAAAVTPNMQRLVIKFPPADPQARLMVHRMGWGRREIGFFQELAAASPLAPPPGTCRHAAIDEASGSSVLLLEHLSDAGWRQGDQVEGCSAETASAVVDALAAHHAQWWGRGDSGDSGAAAGDDRGDAPPPRLPGLPPWLPRSTNLAGLESGPRVQTYLASVWDSVRDKISPELRPVGDALATSYAGLMRVAAHAPTTVVHGDFRLDNLFVTSTATGSIPTCGGKPQQQQDGGGGGERQSERWCAIDWQFVGQQRGATDLAYFIGLCLTPSVRETAEAALRERYVIV